MTDRRRAVAAWAVGAAVLVVVAVAVSLRDEDGDAGAAPSSVHREVPIRVTDAGPVAAAPRPAPIGVAVPFARSSPPELVDIPSIGVHSELESLSLGADGALLPPTRYERAGWYADGPEPGAAGPAVIAGHVDSRSGPAVFYRLGQLGPGDRVDVHRADGSVAHFVVTGAEQYPKAEFPADVVYAPTTDPELRLITCSGAFDRTSGHYVANTVVSARLVAG